MGLEFAGVRFADAARVVGVEGVRRLACGGVPTAVFTTFTGQPAPSTDRLAPARLGGRKPYLTRVAAGLPNLIDARELIGADVS